MKRIRLTESQLHRLIEQALNEWKFWDKYIVGNPKAYGRDLEAERIASQNDPKQRRRREKTIDDYEKREQLSNYRNQKRISNIVDDGERKDRIAQRERQKLVANTPQMIKPEQNESLARRVTESVVRKLRKLNEGYGYEQTVVITMDDYINMLNARRAEIEPRGWTVPNCVWDYFIKTIEECGVGDNAQHNSPSYIVDNVAVNGDYGDFDNYKEEGESDEDFIAHEEDNCIAIFPEERIVIYSL